MVVFVLAFYDIFELLCGQMGITPTQAARDIGITQQAVSLWKKRGSIPKAETLQKISEYFDVHTDYFLGKVDYMPERNYVPGKKTCVIETLPIAEAVKFLNAAGVDISQEETELGIQQDVFPFGICIFLRDGTPHYCIYKKLLIEWINERADEIVFPSPAQPPAQKTIDSTEGKDTPAAQDAPEGAEEGK